MGDAHHDIYDNALWPTIYHDDDDDDDIIHACVLTQIDEMREKEEGKWVTQMEMIGPREREDRFRFAPKGADVEPTRAFFSRQNIPISRSYWEGENDACTRRNKCLPPVGLLMMIRHPRLPMLIQLCLSVSPSLSLSAIAWKAPPLPHCNFICPFLFFSFFSFLSLWIWNWNGRHKWKVMTWLWVLLILQ